MAGRTEIRRVSIELHADLRQISLQHMNRRLNNIQSNVPDYGTILNPLLVSHGYV